MEGENSGSIRPRWDALPSSGTTAVLVMIPPCTDHVQKLADRK